MRARAFYACVREKERRRGRAQRRKRDEYIERRNETWSERERDGGVLIREATVMPRPTTTTLPPPSQLHILTTIRKIIRHINVVKEEKVDGYIFYRLKFTIISRIKKAGRKLHKIAKSDV